MNATRTISALLLSVALAACGDASPAPTTPLPGNNGPTTPGPTNPTAPTPYTMKGVVKNAAGQPLAGVEVWADNTLGYNQNALGKTDAQGRYSISLPRDQIGTWQAGGKFGRQYHGQWFELSLVVDNDTAFATADGAIRNFTLMTSGEQPGGGYYGGTVWAYLSFGGDEFEMNRVEVTLTPDGPLLDGSAGQTLKRFVKGNLIEDVPIGRYRISAMYRPEGGTPRPMVVMNRSEQEYADSTVVMFEYAPKYGIMAEFNLQLPTQ